MGFWIYMLVSVLIIPLLVLYLGYRLVKKGAPKTMQVFFGYRTTRSMVSWDTWTFAHRTLGKIWRIVGLAMIPFSAALIALTIKSDIDVMNIVGMLIIGVQLIVLGVSVFLVENSLKKNFNDRGERTDESLAAQLAQDNAKAEKKAKKTVKK